MSSDHIEVPGSDFDLMRDVYMTKAQREAFDRIRAAALASLSASKPESVEAVFTRDIATGIWEPLYIAPPRPEASDEVAELASRQQPLGREHGEVLAAHLGEFLDDAPQQASAPVGALPPSAVTWHPIETAPKDNKHSLYLAQFNPDTGELIELDWDASWEAESESWEIPQVYYVWRSANDRVEEPTHWAYQNIPAQQPAACVGCEGKPSAPDDPITSYYTDRNRAGWAAPRQPTAADEASAPDATAVGVEGLEQAYCAFKDAASEDDCHPGTAYGKDKVKRWLSVALAQQPAPSAPVGVEAIHPDFARLSTIDELADAIVKNTTSDKNDPALLADVRDCLLRSQQLASPTRPLYTAEQAAAVDEAMRKVAAVAHSGGLLDMSEEDALTAIRRLSLPYWGKEEKPGQVRATLAGQQQGGEE